MKTGVHTELYVYIEFLTKQYNEIRSDVDFQFYE